MHGFDTTDWEEHVFKNNINDIKKSLEKRANCFVVIQTPVRTKLEDEIITSQILYCTNTKQRF